MEDNVFVTEEEVALAVRRIELKLLDAIDEGDLLTVEDMLSRLTTEGWSLDIRDDEGLNTYARAIDGGFAPIVLALLRYKVPLGDALLRACSSSFEEAAIPICKYAKKLPEKEKRAILECHCDNDDFHKALTPLKMAAIRNSFVIVQVLLAAGAERIAEPRLEHLAEASLSVVVEYLDIYRALSSQAYLGLAHTNALANAFRLTGRLRKIGDGWEPVNKEFYDLAEQVENFAASMLNYVANSAELCTLCEQSDKPEIDHPVALMQTAIDFQQKAFISHAFSINIMSNNFYQRLMSSSPRMFGLVTLLSILGYPFLALVYIFWQNEKLENFLRIPHIKLCMFFGSDLAFLALTATACFVDNATVTFTVIIIVFIFCIAISWKHIQDILAFGYEDFLGYGGNLLEMLIIVLTYSLAMCVWIHQLEEVYVGKATQRQSNRIAEIFNRSSMTMTDPVVESIDAHRLRVPWNDPYVIASCLYALVVVLNVMRAFQTLLNSFHDIFFIWESTVGAVKDIVTFLIIYVIFSLAFTFGLSGLYTSQSLVDRMECGGQSCAPPLAESAYSSIPRSMLTLWWTLNGLADAPVRGNPMTVVNFLHIAMASLYLIVALVLINTLIAMLGSRFAAVEEKSDTEWKFGRTKMWLQFIRTDVVIPPPFNLLPTTGALWKLLKRFVATFICTWEVYEKPEDEDSMDETNEKGNPRAVMKDVLNRYNTTKIEKTDEDDSITLDDLRALKEDFLTVKFNIQSKLRVTREMIDAIWEICRSCDIKMPEFDVITTTVDGTKDENSRVLPDDDYQLYKANEMINQIRAIRLWNKFKNATKLIPKPKPVEQAFTEPEGLRQPEFDVPVEESVGELVDVPVDVPVPVDMPVDEPVDESVDKPMLAKLMFAEPVPDPDPLEELPLKPVTPQKLHTLYRRRGGSSLTRNMASMFEGGKTIFEDEDVGKQLNEYRKTFSK